MDSNKDDRPIEEGRLRSRLAIVCWLPDESSSPIAAPNLRYFRYPIDGPRETEKAINEAIEKNFGPRDQGSPYSLWVKKLRRNGLIP
jgi:hypothetical protein